MRLLRVARCGGAHLRVHHGYAMLYSRCRFEASWKQMPANCNPRASASLTDRGIRIVPLVFLFVGLACGAAGCVRDEADGAGGSSDRASSDRTNWSTPADAPVRDPDLEVLELERY